MLPTPLISLYQQYKTDTDSVAGWLASTSMKLGFAPPSAPAQPNWKNKPRKGAKQKPKKKPTTYTIAISDFLPLASHIAGSLGGDPPASIPLTFTSTLDRVIAVRTRFGANLSQRGLAEDKLSDERHAYFVGVLEQVRTTLEPLFAAPEPAEEETKVGNKFAALHLHEPSQAFIDAPDQEPARPRHVEDKNTYQTETDEEDSLFVFCMVMHDISRLRSQVKSIWAGYRARRFELVSASLATNTALDLAKDLMEEVLPLVKKYDARTLITMQYLCLGTAKGWSVEDLMSTGMPGGGNEGTYDIADDAMFNAYGLLHDFSGVFERGVLPLYQGDPNYTYDAASDRSKKNDAEKLQEDQSLLMEILAELATISMYIKYFIEDEFLRGMKELVKTKEIPLHLVLAAQIYLDIHHECRETAVDGSRVLLKEIAEMGDDINKHFEFHKGFNAPGWAQKHDDEVFHRFQDMLSMMAEDSVYVIKVRYFRNKGMPIPEAVVRHRVYIRSPLISGLLLYRARAEMHYAGISIANAFGSIRSACHLYHAALDQNLLKGPWVDMDIAEANIGTHNFYVGGRPTGLAGFSRNFNIQGGVSASAVSGAKAREGRKIAKIQDMASKTGPRGFKGLLPVSTMFEDRYVHTEERSTWTSEHVENVLSRSDFELDDTEETLIVTKVDKSGKTRGQRSERDKGAGKRRPEELVKALLYALQSEAAELVFPYLHFHRICWMMLREVNKSCRQDLSIAYGPAYIEMESQLSFLVGQIFMMAIGSGGTRNLRPFVMAAKVVEEMRNGIGHFMVSVLRNKGFVVVVDE